MLMFCKVRAKIGSIYINIDTSKRLTLMKNLPAPTWVYILECRDGSYYTGCTTNLSMRMAEHKEGTHDIYTAEKRPVKLIWSEEFRDVKSAVDFGEQIKKWSRKKKEALMKGDYEKLRELAQSKEMRLRRMRSNENIEMVNGSR